MGPESPPSSRRARKKAVTRQTLADAALALFAERGFDQVSVREVADAADVAVTTLFAHFPSKESLVFAEEGDRAATLVAAVRERSAGESVVDSLRAYVKDQITGPKRSHAKYQQFYRLVDGTPALVEYGDRLWIGLHPILTDALTDELGLERHDPTCAALALFALDTLRLSRGSGDRLHVVDAGFALLSHGFEEALSRASEQREPVATSEAP